MSTSTTPNASNTNGSTTVITAYFPLVWEVVHITCTSKLDFFAEITRLCAISGYTGGIKLRSDRDDVADVHLGHSFGKRGILWSVDTVEEMAALAYQQLSFVA